MEGHTDLRSILAAFKSSDVVESRVQLLTKLVHLDLSQKSDVAYLLEYLTTFWEDFTCLDVSQCVLNKTILHVASKYLHSDLSECLVQYLTLGTKASLWCGKHLSMSLMSTKDSQEEEHCNIFFQVLLDNLNFSTSSFLAIRKFSLSADEALMVVVERFILEQLNLLKVIVGEIQRITSYISEVTKAAQTVIDSVIRLCKEYSQTVSWEGCDVGSKKDKSSISYAEGYNMNHVVNITAITVEKLCELGILAAKDGGNLVTILNVSWKGVVTLLQLGKHILATKVKVADIIMALISLVNKSIRCAAETWSSSLRETISVTEARRIFVPVKFYLINTVKLSSLFPCEAYVVHRDITLCVLMISIFKFSLSQEKHFRAASEVMTELVDKTSMELLSSLLNSVELKQELKYEILDCLFTDESCTNSDPSCSHRTTLLDEIFCGSCEAMAGMKVLLLGRVVLFDSFLRYSMEFEEDIKVAIARKLGWLLDFLINEEVYSSLLISQIPLTCGSGKAAEFSWEPMFSALLLALKTFMIVVSSSLAWGEVENFLLENFFHPHFLCWEIVVELWCFLVRHAEIDLANGFISKLCALMKSITSSESVLIPSSAPRKMARSICTVLSFGTQSTVDLVYNLLVGDGGNQSSSHIYVALLLEGFPLNLLSDDIGNIAKQKIITDYFNFIETFDCKLSSSSKYGVFGSPVHVLSASLQSLQVSVSDIDFKTLKFLAAVIQNCKGHLDRVMKDNCFKLLSETLAIISNINHLYLSDEMENVIFELQNLFVLEQATLDGERHKCKPDLALFMAGLSHMNMSESDNCAKSSAVWELYHLLLRERHWAFIHLAVTAFGYFCARTKCNQLWRFVPQDAALAYDLVSGNEANEERFMSELKIFLEKEVALLTIVPCSEQLGLLLKEGLVLKEIVHNISNINIEVKGCDSMEIDCGNQSNKRRKLPDGISKGVELLQNGLKAIGDCLCHWQTNHLESAELHNKFLTHFASLEDVIANLISLTDRS